MAGTELVIDESDRAIYQAQRAHELELNRATAAFEHAVTSPLLLLNGGAVVVFLTLLGATSAEKSSLVLDITWATLAISSWALGLAAVAVAVRSGYRSQQQFTRAVTARRCELELLILPESPPLKPLLERARVERDSGAGAATPAKLQGEAKEWQTSWQRFSTAALVLFVLGVILATLSIFLAR